MPKPGYRSYIFEKTTATGQTRYYCRFFSPEGKEIVTRSLGPTINSMRDAQRAALNLARTLDLESFEEKKKIRQMKSWDADSKLRETPFCSFVVSFWTPETSEYLRSAKRAGKALSQEYVENRRRYAERFLLSYPPFQKPLRQITFRIVEKFLTFLEDEKILTANQIEPILRSLQKPVSWAVARELVDLPFVWSALTLPATNYRTRGVLTTEQLASILKIPISPMRMVGPRDNQYPLVVFRKRLPKGEHNQGPGPIDIRMKAALALSFLAGLRRGEIRGLRWTMVDFPRKTISVEANYVRRDGSKSPKSGSTGLVPMAAVLAQILIELESVSQSLGIYDPTDFVLFGSKPKNPIADSALRKGFMRAMAHLGIDENTRKTLNLKFHGGRHFFASLLSDEIGEIKASRMTRHSTANAFAGYADHQSTEVLSQARNAIDQLVINSVDCILDN